MDVETLIGTIAGELRQVDGIVAVVLGGSRARGTATPSSDIDLGLYYDPAAPFDLARLGRIAAELDDSHRPDLLTAPGGWGPNINGGGWLKIGGQAVDFLYKDLERVGAAVRGCCVGEIWFEYQPGHPHGFGPHIYLGEIALCRPLHDPRGAVAALKAMAEPYPPALAAALVARFWWEAGFSVDNARKSIARTDVVHAAGCCYRAAACLLQTLFAINGAYWMNEKGAAAIAAGFAHGPPDVRPRLERAIGGLAADGAAIAAAIDGLAALLRDTEPIVESRRAAGFA